jgi:hypothetical protein
MWLMRCIAISAVSIIILYYVPFPIPEVQHGLDQLFLLIANLWALVH